MKRESGLDSVWLLCWCIWKELFGSVVERLLSVVGVIVSVGVFSF